jgi:hypothetical protein
VIAASLKWLEDNPKHQQAYNLLGALVAARSADVEVIAASLKWLEDNPKHQQAYWLLGALVAARSADVEVIAASLKWIEDNPKHQQAYNLLMALVAARSADDEVIAASLKWIEDNPKHQQAYNLLMALVAARTADERVLEVARGWLHREPGHPQTYNLLSTLITRSDGAEEWIAKGEAALVNASGGAGRTLLVALLAGSKANIYFIERTIDAIIAEMNMGRKTHLRIYLGRTLANNIQNALLFLSGQSTSERKLVAAQALVRGLERYANRAQEFLEIGHTAPSEYLGLLLAACIASKVAEETLNDLLLPWLNDHQRMRGYGAVLKALKQHPERWQALIESGNLSDAVQIDFHNLSEPNPVIR